jgi:hypothetical protein
MKPEEWTLRQIEQQAVNFLKLYLPNLVVPVPIEEILELQLNIRIVVYPELESRFGVNGLINNSFDAIGIDEKVYTFQKERTRFTLTEELGHKILHKDWYEKYGPPSFTDFLDWHVKLDPIIYDYIERQAKTFAGYVLAPSDILVPEWREFTKSKGSDHLQLDQLPDNFPGFCIKFGIAPQSMLLRLEKSGFLSITPEQKDILFNKRS